MSLFRRRLLLTGAAGLLLCGTVALLAAWLVLGSLIRPPFPFPAVATLLALVLGTFSVAEIPLMVVALRRLAGEREENRGSVWALNVLYVGFAAVYGAPVVLLTGSLSWSLALCGLGLVRFLTSLIFIRESARR